MNVNLQSPGTSVNDLILRTICIMATLLCIDTAGETATVGLGNEDGVITAETSTDQKNHAAFIQSAVQRILSRASVDFSQIDAVAVVNGPGSYTGLRVGLASAKGICYALNKPLITLNTLAVMALAAMEDVKDSSLLYCPLIDARRNEVFTAVYDSALHVILPPQPKIVEPESFNIYLDKQRVVFFGSGHNKCMRIINHTNANFEDVFYTGNQINKLAINAYKDAQFADIAYTEPFYTKDFFLQG